jgi:uncharacterized protein
MAYQFPGVYVEEVPGGSRPIEAVGSSTAGFVGCAPDKGKQLHKPVLITNWTQFLKTYCGADPESTPLSHAVYGFFLNGGANCYVVNCGDTKTITGSAARREGLQALETIDEVALVSAPGFSDIASQTALLDHCELMGDRFALLDPPPTDDEFDLQRLTQIGSEGGAATEGVRPPFRDSGYGAFYYPRIEVADPFQPKLRSVIGPSGHLAGVYARTDFDRGVHKAPANATIRGALDLERRVTRGEQAILNPAGVNVIRFFANSGILIWGARTVAEASSEYRYINVRRVMNVIKESIEQGTRWVVFEPNDDTLWRSIRRDVGAFLTGLWRRGALRGATPDEAFYVKCDAETNSTDVIDRGEVVTEIGVCIVKPAEFIIFRIGQSLGVEEPEEETEGEA